MMGRKLPIVAMALLTVALRLPFATAPLGIDEGGLAFVARGWGTGGSSLYGRYWVDRPPLLLALFKVAGLGGAHGVRVLGALAAVALVALAHALGREAGGRTTARTAGVLTAVLASSVAIKSVFTPAELLASVPAAGSVLCLLRSREHGPAWLAGAGALATAAFLVKQSFVDAFAAGAAFLLVRALSHLRRPVAATAAYVAGGLLPLAGVALWFLVAPAQADHLPYALIGFRVDGLRALAVSNIPLTVRVRHLDGPALASGIALVLAACPFALWRIRRERVLAATLGAWLAGGAIGVLGGGSYWAHYLIQLVVPAAIVTARVLDDVGAAPRRALVLVVAVTVVAFNAAGVVRLARGHADRSELAVADYLRDRAAPGDTQYVMYAKANVDYYSGLPSPFPYAWSLMMRTIPSARSELAQLLSSPQRPTWIVGWQRPRRWGLDPRGVIAARLQRHYRVATVIDGHPIYHASARLRPPPAAARGPAGPAGPATGCRACAR